MPLELFALYSRLPLFALVAGRLGGVIMFLPMFGGLAVPTRVRMIFVVGLAVLVTPLIRPGLEAPPSLIGVALALSNEVLLGAVIGLSLRAVFIGLELAGLLIAQQSGLAFGQIADPTTGVQTSLLSAFYVQLAGIVFLILGGHRVLVAVTLDSFDAIPPFSDHGTFVDGIGLLIDAIALGGEIAIRVAAPVLLTLFLINVALGFIGRTVPQLNIITIGFPIKGLVGFMLMAISLPAAMEAFILALDEVVGWVDALIAGAT